MQCKTIRIKAEPSEKNPAGAVVINLSDFDPSKHAPFSDEDVEALRGSAVADLNPMIVAGARGELQHRHAELQAEAARQREQGEILETERKRLEALAADLKAQAAGATPPAAPDLTAAQMKELLTERGIDFKSNASKADLQALLDTPAA